jgi:hypothetical protein
VSRTMRLSITAAVAVLLAAFTPIASASVAKKSSPCAGATVVTSPATFGGDFGAFGTFGETPNNVQGGTGVGTITLCQFPDNSFVVKELHAEAWLDPNTATTAVTKRVKFSQYGPFGAFPGWYDHTKWTIYPFGMVLFNIELVYTAAATPTLSATPTSSALATTTATATQPHIVASWRLKNGTPVTFTFTP